MIYVIGIGLIFTIVVGGIEILSLHQMIGELQRRVYIDRVIERKENE